MIKHNSRKYVNWLVLLALVLMTATSTGAAPKNTIEIQLLNVSDWHGQLDPLVVGTNQIGGAAALSAYFQAERADNPNSLTLTAGDAVGATPPLSSFFADEPTILAMNMMGFQVDTLGNHNFDGGIARLQSQIDLAEFQYVSANLQNRDDNLTGVSDFEIFDVGGVKVAVIGVTNPEAPELVFPGNFGTIVPTEPVRAALRARNAAKDAGAEIIVVITHMGVTGFDPNGMPFGPLIDFAMGVNKDKKDPKIDVIVGDHTDIQFEGIINGALVYENRSRGLTYAKAVLTIDASNRKIISKDVEFVTPFVSNVTPDPAIVALLQPYREALAPILNTQIGSSLVGIPRADACGRGDGRLCESLIGNTVTDAMRTQYGVDFAITNSGGLRANLTCPTTDSPTDFCPPFAPPPYPITRGQVLSVLPFGNIVVTLQVNGAELKTMLEQGVSSMPGANGRFAQVSGLCFTYDIAAPVGSRVTRAVRQAADGSCSGAPVDLTAASTYSIAENDFMANAGDGYPNFTSRMVTRDIMDQVLADYVAGNSPINPAIQGRIVCTTSGATLCPALLP
ncbi:MAG TPA: 5'-nucleotidase C-terminal domain-containing protein [Anaerolineales bacterium]|nr:5'-nucleotidase C-terminal domain-containing protein [Anaerolineales bacterium]